MKEKKVLEINAGILEVSEMCDMIAEKLKKGDRVKAEAMVTKVLNKIESLRLKMGKNEVET